MPRNPNETSFYLLIGDYATFEENERCTEDGNNHWFLRAYTNVDYDENEKYLALSLLCNKNSYSNVWSCNATVRFTLQKNGSEIVDDGFIVVWTKKLTRDDNSIELPKFKKWEDLAHLFVDEDNAVVTCSITVKERVLQTFEEPKENVTDVVLLVEGKKVHVGKQVLAMHSKYFHTLFFSDFEEKTKTEIPIKDVSHSEFIDLLNLIYPSDKQIEWIEVEHILKLADRFEVSSAIKKIEQLLMYNNIYTDDKMVGRLIHAEKYKLAALQNHCCKKIKSIQDVFDLTKDERYHELGADTHGLLFRRLVEIQKGSDENDNATHSDDF